ncbi:MAG: DUF6391 domain-containing protein [Anaerolineales bacterium]
MATFFAALLKTPRLLRTRRNHALEHASIYGLTARNPRRMVAGHSDAGGFWLLGELNTEEVRQAVDEAMRRLRAGEHWLAVHPNCGTNLMTAASLTGLAGGLAMRGANRRGGLLERLPLAILFSVFALIAARPLGARLQERITTSSDLGPLEVIDIRRSQRGQFTAHRVETRS